MKGNCGRYKWGRRKRRGGRNPYMYKTTQKITTIKIAITNPLLH